MEPISITISGSLAGDPRPFTTGRGTAAVSLWLEVPLPPRGFSSEGISRYLKVLAFGLLAENVTGSLHAGDRITVRADDLRSEAYEKDGSSRSCPVAVATDISASLLRDTATTGSSERRAARAAAAGGRASDLPAAEQADARVLAGVTAGTA